MEEERSEESTEIVVGPEDKSRSAQEYVKAFEAVAEITLDVVGLIPGLSETSAALKLATKAVKIAPKLKVAARAYDKISESHAFDAVKEHAPDVAKAAFVKAGEAKDKALDPVKGKMAEQAAAKARREARRGIVEAAEAMSVEEFKKRYAAFESLLTGESSAFLCQPGCYVFALLGKGRRDLAGYRQVYVGAASESMGSSVAAELAGFGNPDVYADAKYEQNLFVLPYPCAADKVSALRDALITALDANVSYNAREMEAVEE